MKSELAPENIAAQHLIQSRETTDTGLCGGEPERKVYLCGARDRAIARKESRDAMSNGSVARRDQQQPTGGR